MKKITKVFLTAGILLLMLLSLQAAAGAEEQVIYEQTFNVTDMTYRSDPDAFVAALNNLTTGQDGQTSGEVSVSFGNYLSNYKKDGYTEITDYLNENNDFSIESGRLKIAKQGGYGTVANNFKFTFPNTAGQLRISFDLEIKSYSGYSTSGIQINGKNGGFSGGMMGGDLHLQWNVARFNTDFADGSSHKAEFLIDLDTRQYWGISDNTVLSNGMITLDKSNKVSDIGSFLFSTLCSGGEDNTLYYIDNFKVTKVDKPQVTSTNIPTGSSPVGTDPLYMEFNVPMNEDSLRLIKLYEGDKLLEELDYQISADKKRVMLNTPLKNSTIYKVAIGDRAVMAENGFYIGKAEYTVYAEHKAPAVSLDAAAGFTTGQDDSVKVSGALSNSGTKPMKAVLILVQYEGDKVKKIESKTYQLAAGESAKQISATILPEATVGTSTYRAFFWCGDSLMELIAPAASPAGQ